MRTSLGMAVVVTGLMVAACTEPLLMGAVAAFSDRSEEFEGTWSYRRGSRRIRCEGEGSQTVPLEDSGTELEFRGGIGSDLSLRLDGCTWEFDVVGQEAYFRLDEDCRSFSGFLDITTQVKDGIFVLDATGKEITQEETVFEVRTRDGDVVRTCTETWSGELRKARSQGTSGGFSSSSSSSGGFTSSSSSGGAVSCTNTCSFADDGECDDGGPGSSFSVCDLGTDCLDCGAR